MNEADYVNIDDALKPLNFHYIRRRANNFDSFTYKTESPN